jgi:hypothetical protein
VQFLMNQRCKFAEGCFVTSAPHMKQLCDFLRGTLSHHVTPPWREMRTRLKKCFKLYSTAGLQFDYFSLPAKSNRHSENRDPFTH